MSRHSYLDGIPKETLLDLIRRFNGGRLGFNPDAKDRNFCAIWLTNLASRTEIETAAGIGAIPLAPTVDPLAELDRALAPIASQTPPVPPVAIPSKEPIPAMIPEYSAPADAGTQLAGLIAQIAQAGCNEARVREIVAEIAGDAIAKAAASVVQVQHTITLPEPPAIILPPGSRPELVTAIARASQGQHLFLTGPTGSGKTHMAKQVAEHLGREFASISCSAGMSESRLEGWLVPGPNGEFVYLSSDFVRLYESGGVFCKDEIDAADSNTLLVTNSALSNDGFYLPQRKGNTYVKRHPDFVLIATANTYGTGATMQYAGRARLDEATLDRFRLGTIYVDYDATLEASLGDVWMLNFAKRVRTAIREHRLQRVMSTRTIIQGTKMLRSGAMTPAEIEETFFLGWKADERAKVAA